MTTIRRYLVVWVICFILTALPGISWALDKAAGDVQAVITLLQEQNNKLSVEIRRIHREIAALRADLDKPDARDIFGGIGYILGLCGAAALVAARRRQRDR